MADHVLNAEPVMAVLTPYAMARSAHHLFQMARAYNAKADATPIRLYVFCVSIEIGMKAAILGEDCTEVNKQLIKGIGHDLVKLNAQFETTFQNKLLDEDDIDALTKINPYFRDKGLEYFTTPMLVSTLKGRSDFPETNAIEAVARKVQEFLETRDFFIEGKTTQLPSGEGIIQFI